MTLHVEPGRLLFYLDMHAHAHTRGCILYGNRLSGASQAGHVIRFHEIVPDSRALSSADCGNAGSILCQVWNVAFARICELNGPHFDFEGCEFPPTSDKDPSPGSAGLFAASMFLSIDYYAMLYGTILILC